MDNKTIQGDFGESKEATILALDQVVYHTISNEYLCQTENKDFFLYRNRLTKWGNDEDYSMDRQSIQPLSIPEAIEWLVLTENQSLLDSMFGKKE